MKPRTARPGAVALTAALLLAACSGGEPQAITATVEDTAPPPPPESPSPPPTEEPAPSPIPSPEPPPAAPPPAAQLEQVRLAAEPFVADIENLTGMAWRPGDPALYFTTQDGMIHRVVDGVRQPVPVLDMTSMVTPFEPGSERGLLGITFDPLDITRLYLYWTDASDGHSQVASFEVGADGVAVPASRIDVLAQPQPGLGHKGGQLAFDEAGNLFISFGDGGGSNGRDAQDMSTMLGSIVRIVPRRSAPGYDVPPDNPFVGQPGVAPELWVKGLRNPWRFSIDDETGDIWLSDVGHKNMEEINLIPAGQKGLNFGWYFFEGTRPNAGGGPPGLVPPVFEWTHEVGPAAIGGFVYRGSAIPSLAGAYVFGDLGGTTWARGSDGVVQLPIELDGAVTSFAELPDGELLVLTLYEGVFRLVPA